MNLRWCMAIRGLFWGYDDTCLDAHQNLTHVTPTDHAGAQAPGPGHGMYEPTLVHGHAWVVLGV